MRNYHVYFDGYGYCLVLGDTEKERMQNIQEYLMTQYKYEVEVKEHLREYLEQDASSIDFDTTRKVINIDVS